MAELSNGSPFGATPNDGSTLDSRGGREFYRNSGEGNVAHWKDIELWWRTYEVGHGSAAARHKHPGVAGQVIEYLGREPYSVSMEVVFFGEDWQRRLDNFLVALDEQTSGLLVLPDGRAFDAGCMAGTEKYDDTLGCVLPLEFEEDTQDDAQRLPTQDDASALDGDLADFATQEAAVRVYLDEYLSLVNSPSRVATRELLDAYRQLDAALYAQQQACDLLTQDGIGAEAACAMARWHAQSAFPSPELLG